MHKTIVIKIKIQLNKNLTICHKKKRSNKKLSKKKRFDNNKEYLKNYYHNLPIEQKEFRREYAKNYYHNTIKVKN